jgi:hypothetical protein
MMSTFDMKPHDWAAIVFGIVGMVFALLAYYHSKRSEERSIQTEKRSAATAFVQKRQEVVQVLFEIERAIEGWRREFDLLSRSARTEKAKEAIATSAKVLAPLVEMCADERTWLDNLSVTDSHEVMLRLEERLGNLNQTKLVLPEIEKTCLESIATARNLTYSLSTS